MPLHGRISLDELRRRSGENIDLRQTQWLDPRLEAGVERIDHKVGHDGLWKRPNMTSVSQKHVVGAVLRMSSVEGSAIDPYVVAIGPRGKPLKESKVEQNGPRVSRCGIRTSRLYRSMAALKAKAKEGGKHTALERLGEFGQLQDAGQSSDQNVDPRAGPEDRIDRDPKVGLCTSLDGLDESGGVLGLESIDEVIASNEDDDDAHCAASDLLGQARELPALDQVRRGGVAPRPVEFKSLVSWLSTALRAVAAEVQAPCPSQDLYPVFGCAAIGGIELVLVRITVAEYADTGDPPLLACSAS